MQKLLEGKTALITGASGGLGEQFARCLSAAGARVILSARRVYKIKNLAEELENSIAIGMDVSDPDSVKKAFKNLEKAEEKIDICINNAAIAKQTPLFESDDKGDFASVMQTNVMGVWCVTKNVAQHMKKHDIHGSIINIGSINGDTIPAQEFAAYSISKAAVIHLTKTLVGELSPHNIRINCINPGLHRTPLTQDRIENDSIRSTLEKMIPLGFVAEPHDLDGVLLFLASNDSSRYVTGSCITMDGGVSWRGAK